ncbi:AraC family transcriptional regulator [Pseudomonas huaxiensis]|uniref:AraC family transcriptional regulator n=1 Tax=Pseudomonas huaxiensis TaxID=2213017 RepID=UPI000DA67E10|nr:AraC family transcriptional regulator [Pseudomonas huaxiensis]
MSDPHHFPGRQALCDLIKPLATRPGFVDTLLSDVQVLSWAEYVASSPQIYEPSLMVLAQGRKLARLGERTLDYGAGQYLVQALSVPFMCETFASEAEPLYGVAVGIDPLVLSEMVQAMDPLPAGLVRAQTPKSMSSAPLDEPMQDAVLRLLQCLQRPEDARVMGAARVREVYFAALNGPQAGALRALVEQQGHFARIGASLAYLRDHYADPLSIDELAGRANMSASAFHEHFKRNTLLSPIQYLKRLRLLKAQQMLIGEGLGVAQVAHRVGYQSSSQFSREYKRQFSRSPGDEVPYRGIAV